MAEQPVAIVTAAGKGIGAACARELAARGYALSLMSPSGRSVKLAEKLGCLGMNGSVTEQADIDRLVEATLKRYGRIDAVCNNTGFEKWSVVADSHGAGFNPDVETHLLDIPDEDWHEALDLFMLNVLRMARAVTEPMRRQGGGAFVNISASCALEPMLEYPISSTVRSALSSFTKLYSDHYARDNIRMNTLLIGYVGNLDFPSDAYRSIPMARAASLEEIARTTAMLLSPDASYITGESIYVDGGLSRAL